MKKRLKEIFQTYNIKECTSLEDKIDLFMFSLCIQHFENFKTLEITESLNSSSKDTMATLFRFLINKKWIVNYLYDKILVATLFRFLINKKWIVNYLYDKILVNEVLRENIFKSLTDAMIVLDKNPFVEGVKEKNEDVYTCIVFLSKFAAIKDSDTIYIAMYHILNGLVFDLNSLAIGIMSNTKEKNKKLHAMKHLKRRNFLRLKTFGNYG
ncbi:hypothetical protein NGRA_0938 [Nosema granulosis]|uniref:Uncharacterized protein n=1 Tax=Nosema granulosis TaxID=83296 RepID=A0A9P6KZU9_9MICR|nr:hypothetical protein NGRA_0938 [Nosema granulosis]